jgi:hypothetical protein
MDLLDSLDALADGDVFHVDGEMRAHIWSRYEDRRMEGYGAPFDEFCAEWADNIRGEQHDDEAAAKGWEAAS